MDFDTLQQLAARHLRLPKVQLAPQIPLERAQGAIAVSGVGLDHFDQEQVLAILDMSIGDAFDTMAMVTDRRIAGMGFGAEPRHFQVRFADMNGVKDDSSFLNGGALIVSTPLNQVRVKVTGFAKPVMAFLSALGQLPPEHRVPAPQPLVTPTAEDPTGAAALVRGLSMPDQRIQIMLDQILKGHASARYTAPLAHDLTRRVMLLYLTMLRGRGMREGQWLSPLSPADLGYSFARLFGPPVSVTQDGPTQIHDYNLGSGRSGTGAAVASTAVGLAAMAVFGVGWVSRPGKTLGQVRVRLTPNESSTRFNVLGFEENRWMALSAFLPKAFAKVLEGLCDIEATTLMLRCMSGFGASTADLFAQLAQPPPAQQRPTVQR